MSGDSVRDRYIIQWYSISWETGFADEVDGGITRTYYYTFSR